MKKILYPIIFLSAVFCQNQEVTLSQVSVEGNILSSQNTILFTSGLREGLKVNNTEFQRAVKRLWNLGLFEDVQLRLDNSSLDNLSVTILVKENLFFPICYLKGIKKLNLKFIEELDFVKGQRIRLNTLHEIEKRLKIFTEKKVILMLKLLQNY